VSAYQLPSGRVVDLTTRGEPRARRAEHGAPLFAEVKGLVEAGDVALRGADLASLALADFHALRAILTRLGWVFEEPVELTCRNCQAPLTHAPCAALPLGPFADRELGDPELDVTLPLGVPHDVPGLGAVVLGPLTVSEAAPLHAALAEPTLRLSPRLVRAMGALSIGGESRPAHVARLLERAPEASWGAVTDLFLRAHYPPRLFSIAMCPSCGARNDVDAPYDREFDPTAEVRASHAPDPARAGTDVGENTPFPTFAAFDGVASTRAARLLAEAGAEGVALVVESGVAACDDGGEPLLGAYLPGDAGDMHTPSRQPEITVYYRTFRAIWDEEGPYDWRAELDETLEHELAHHLAELAGGDPVDDDERHEIAREAARVVGGRALVRTELRAFSTDLAGFWRRTWPVWLLLLLAVLAVTLVEER
jgi:hypothetical protein